MTIYGRNAVIEALEDESISIHKLHLSSSNKSATVLSKMIALAKSRDIGIVYHDKKALSRISKNSKQDQGVALDMILPNSLSDLDFISTHNNYRTIALDGITNPQNMGMIIRSCAAGNIDAVIIPSNKSAQISPLVIKASTGTLFKIPIIKTTNLKKTLELFAGDDGDIYALSSDAKYSYKDEIYADKSVFVLGNESRGLSSDIRAICHKSISIPMHRGVESLNVAVTASLLAFME